jgi:hypothetical protein
MQPANGTGIVSFPGGVTLVSKAHLTIGGTFLVAGDISFGPGAGTSLGPTLQSVTGNENAGNVKFTPQASCSALGLILSFVPKDTTYSPKVIMAQLSIATVGQASEVINAWQFAAGQAFQFYASAVALVGGNQYVLSWISIA